MRVDSAALDALDHGLRSIREENRLTEEFPADVEAAAAEAAARDASDGHHDRTSVEFVTLDPASSTDLDQAFAIERSGADLLLHYAIADVAFFVESGDALDTEAWNRGVTVYLPAHRTPLYPPSLSQGAASLLPGGPRPAVVFTVRVDPDGDVSLDGCQRALVRSRAKLGYETVDPTDLPDGFADLSRRIAAAEARRGAPRVEFPEQQLERVGDSWRFHMRPRLAAEDDNAAMSLATNLAVARALYDSGTGLFRVMPAPDDRQIRRLRFSARAVGLEWPADVDLDAFVRSLERDDPRASAFLIAIRRAGGGASYQPYRPGVTPWHGAMRATYVHATAPLRRLADRYVIEAALAVANGEPVPTWVSEAFERLPRAMARGENVANRAEGAAIELAEAVVLAERVGESFHAVVIDESPRGVQIQLAALPIITTVVAHHVDPGDDITVRLDRVDVPKRHTEFARVS